MEKITRGIGKNRKNQYVAYIYTQQEADDLGMKYKYWKDDPQGGDWILTDDGYVGQVRYVKEYTGKKGTKKFLVATFGVAWITGAAKLTWENRRATGDYFNYTPRHWIDREVQRSRAKRALKLYANMLITGKVNYELCGKVYNPLHLYPAQAFKKLLRAERVQKLIDQELQRILGDMGIDKKFVIEKHVLAIEIGEKKKDGYLILKGADGLAEYLDMKPGKTKVTEQVETSATTLKQIGDVIAQHETLKLTQTKEVREIPEFTKHGTSRIEKVEPKHPDELEIKDAGSKESVGTLPGESEDQQ